MILYLRGHREFGFVLSNRSIVVKGARLSPRPLPNRILTREIGTVERIPIAGGSPVDASQIALLDPKRFEESVPHEWFTCLRHDAPIFKHAELGGPAFGAVTRYDDVGEANRDGRT